MSLVNRLQSEIKANPAKAAGLGVLLIVAGYFWAPLVKGFFAGAEPVPAPPVAAATPGTPAPAPPPTIEPTKTAEQPYDWQKYAQLMDDDAKMRWVGELSSSRDPFETPQVEPAETAVVKVVEEKPKTAEGPPLDPREAGIVLTSTFVGPRKQIALIGGKPYSIGDRVRAQKDGLKASFKLIDVQPRLVVLERNGKQYELAITRAGSKVQQVLTSAESDDESEDEESSESEMALDGPAAR